MADHCICGRAYVPLRMKNRGRQTIGCPRFPRSWRNLWIGGMGHYARANTPDDYKGIPLSMIWR